MDLRPTLPDYGGANVSGIVPGLLGGPPGSTVGAPWFPAPLRNARQVVLFVVDGLGWEQLQTRRHLAPVIAALEGGPITTVAPSTTATALTSITTGRTPAEHGIVGYRVDFGGEIVNMLRWGSSRGDARLRIPPNEVQPHRPFLGASVPVVSRIDLQSTAFTQAHLAGVRPHGWRVPSNLAVEVSALLAAGEPFVYAYYDGLDKVAHEFGFGPHYDAELRAIDVMVANVLDGLPSGAVLAVTADHGQVHVGERVVDPHPSVLDATRYQSGEGRFRWFHARPGAAAALLDAAHAHADVAWVLSREQVIDERWFGQHTSSLVARRLGDVALAARDDISFEDPADSGPLQLVCRHGSLTSAEMYVPLVVSTGG